MGQSFKIQLEDTQKGPHWSLVVYRVVEKSDAYIINYYFAEIRVSEFDIWHDGGWPIAPETGIIYHFLASYWSMTNNTVSWLAESDQSLFISSLPSPTLWPDCDRWSWKAQI